MKNKSLIFLLTLALILSSVMFVSALDSVGIVTANNTEFNNVQPTITINATGNSSAYLVIVRVENSSGVLVAKNTFQILNATNTAVILDGITFTEGQSYKYNFTAYNSTNDLAGNLTSVRNIMEINMKPVISSVTRTGNKVNNGIVGINQIVNWTVSWTDTNSSAGRNDSLQVYVCKTNSFTTTCATGQTWDISSAETDKSTNVNYTIKTSDTAGTKNFYIFLLDDGNYASAVSSGNFQIQRGGEPIEGFETGFEDTPIPVPEKKKSPVGWILGIIVVIGALYLLFNKK